jgi:hypothetical protein
VQIKTNNMEAIMARRLTQEEIERLERAEDEAILASWLKRSTKPNSQLQDAS